MEIKRYLKEMANDIMDKIINDKKYGSAFPYYKKYVEKIQKAIKLAEQGYLTNIETIGEIMAAYDDFVYEAYTN